MSQPRGDPAAMTGWPCRPRGAASMSSRSRCKDGTSPREGWSARLAGMIALLLVLATAGAARADEALPPSAVPIVATAADAGARSPKFFKVCHDQTYALC